MPSEHFSGIENYEELRNATLSLLASAERWLLETGPGQHVNTACGRGSTRRAVERLREIVDGGGLP